MPSATATIDDFILYGLKYSSGTPFYNKTTKEFNLSGIMNGSTVNSAYLYMYTTNRGTVNVYRRYPEGTDITIRNVQGDRTTTPIDVTPIFNGVHTFGSSFGFGFEYLCPSNGNSNTFRNIRLVLNYTLPYTSCTAPASVAVASTNVAPGATVRLSWSGAQAGTNNPISSYTVYRSSDNENWTVLQSGITNTYLDVTAPSTNGAKYYYRVVAVGSVSGYNSAMSSATGEIACSFSAPSVSGVEIDNSSSAVYKAAGASASLTWTGTAGTNNPITKYEVYNGNTKLGETTGTSYSITAPAAGNSAIFSVKPIGTYSDGTSVNSPTLYGYSAPSAPTTLSLSKNNVAPGASVTLSWSGAAAGRYCDITGYRIMRATSADGTYTQLGEDISSSATSGSVSVAPHSDNNASYFYKVITLGSRANSGASDYAQLTTKWTNPTVTNVKLDGSASDIYREAGDSCVLTWDFSDGQNNAVQKFHIYRGSSKIGETTEQSYTVAANETAGSYYQYKVKPIGTLGNGDYSASIKVYTYSAPVAPNSVVVGSVSPDAGTNTTLSWSGAQNGSFNEITGYRIFRATAAAGTYTQLGADLAADVTSITVTAPLEMGASYYYKVMPLGQRKNGSMSSAYATVTAQTYTVPSAPVSVAVDSGTPDAGTNTTLRWSGASAGTNNPITGYRVMRSDTENGTYSQYGADLASDASSLSVPAPSTMGEKYFYRVLAIGTKSGFLLSAASSAVQVMAQIYTKCTEPNSVQISKTLANPGDTVTVSWSGANAGTNNPISGYDVFRSTGGTYSVFQHVAANVSSITDTVGASGTKYSYKVVTRGTKTGFDSLESAIVSVISNTKPGKISSFVTPDAVYEDGVFRVSWNAPADVDSNIDHYIVQRRSKPLLGSWSDWAQFASVTVTHFDDQPLFDRGTSFMYRVCAVDALGLSGDYLETQVFRRNQTPGLATILLPASGKTTFNKSPYLILSVPAEPDGQKQYIYISADGGAYTLSGSVDPTGGQVSVRVGSVLSVGALHTISVRLRDSMGASGPETTTAIRVEAISWGRTIARGTLISRIGPSFSGDSLRLTEGVYSLETLALSNVRFDDETMVVIDSGGVSHQAEIEQLYACVNNALSYYGLDPLTVPASVGDNYSNKGAGKIGMFADWGTQMAELQTALRSLQSLVEATRTRSALATPGMHPTASIISEIRSAVENL